MRERDVMKLMERCRHVSLKRKQRKRLIHCWNIECEVTVEACFQAVGLKLCFRIVHWHMPVCYMHIQVWCKSIVFRNGNSSLATPATVAPIWLCVWGFHGWILEKKLVARTCAVNPFTSHIFSSCHFKILVKTNLFIDFACSSHVCGSWQSQLSQFVIQTTTLCMQ